MVCRRTSVWSSRWVLQGCLITASARGHVRVDRVGQEGLALVCSSRGGVVGTVSGQEAAGAGSDVAGAASGCAGLQLRYRHRSGSPGPAVRRCRCERGDEQERAVGATEARWHGRAGMDPVLGERRGCRGGLPGPGVRLHLPQRQGLPDRLRRPARRRRPPGRRPGPPQRAPAGRVGLGEGQARGYSRTTTPKPGTP